jgi:hypothetical protein
MQSPEWAEAFSSKLKSESASLQLLATENFCFMLVALDFRKRRISQMVRIFLITAAATLSAGILPASAYTCAEWCSTYHCRMTEPARHRVCMNRCVASCRAVVTKRRARAHEQAE